MIMLQLCFWFGFISYALIIVSFLCIIDIVACTGINFAIPGFLRAGNSFVIFETVTLLCKHDDMWTRMSSCLGFLPWRDSWHPRICCIMLWLI
jgi:hypothetical protein